MPPERLDVEQALPRMQELASRLWSPQSRHHPGQLAWSGAYVVTTEDGEWVASCCVWLDDTTRELHDASQAKKAVSPSSSRSTSASSL